MITCDNCGKFVEGNDVGTHWICEDCSIDENLPKTDVETYFFKKGPKRI